MDELTKKINDFLSSNDSHMKGIIFGDKNSMKVKNLEKVLSGWLNHIVIDLDENFEAVHRFNIRHSPTLFIYNQKEVDDVIFGKSLMNFIEDIEAGEKYVKQN